MYVTHSSLNGIESEPGSATGPDHMEKLMADWSWNENAPVDPGYVYTAEEVQLFQFAMSFRETTKRSLPAFRAWSFPAYTGPAVRPPRIGPNVG